MLFLGIGVSEDVEFVSRKLIGAFRNRLLKSAIHAARWRAPFGINTVSREFSTAAHAGLAASIPYCAQQITPQHCALCLTPDRR